MPDLRDFITPEEAARMLGFHVEHVRRLLREGDLKGEKIGKAWLVLRKSVEDYISFTKGMNKYDPNRRDAGKIGD
ncbi:MAG TPA: helix-turn-helix domain-containing protein [Prolixibacteraceae bacterium]|nr:helix-turn-helix domain-containing protein [Prolixibacteraceae bacterium]HPH98669.1 helix-turn-helix domain-containing protein [Anaerolineaceae bacterium]HPN54284.1 helix-turn-helix domain-containing protein [Anaerolineaceae bacterium]